MGQVVIEMPDGINRYFKIKNKKFGDRLIRDLEDNDESEKSSSVAPPRRNSMKADGDKILGLWAEREESGLEIARKIREANRKVT